MTYHINYSFTYRSDPETVHSVNVPLSRLEGMELSLDNVKNVVEEDLNLIAVLMGKELKAYESMSMAPHLYQKDLQRLDESIRLVRIME